ncbi:hypothetical protein RclHR1_21500001 [Rhizophagus clarus]|uniref:Uncharacterized protein n=1 Tax=Rhizophagus clarus TaxID=94130 RepID=A0A2Z6RLZ2_9GLOM|nr:hypothetical protein RclHR1_21500001 [Rhizophagus clarus]
MLFCSQLRKNASQTKFVKSKHGNFADFRPFLPRSQVIKKRAARKPLSLSSTTPPVSNVNTQTERMLTDEVNSPQASPSNVHNVFQIQSTVNRLPLFDPTVTPYDSNIIYRPPSFIICR